MAAGPEKPGKRAAPSSTANTKNGLWKDIRKGYWPFLFISPFFILFLIFGLYPTIYSFFLSFTNWGGQGSPRFIGLKNFELLLSDKIFWQSMLNGVFFFFLYVPAMILLGLALAVLLNSRRIHGFRIFRTLIFLPFITNKVAAGFVFQLLLNQNYGPVNSALAFIGLPAVAWLDSIWGARISLSIMILWAWLGYVMVIMLAGLQTIPSEMVEAATIDGANSIQSFFYIIIPMMRPVLTFVLVLATMGSFDLFTESMSLFPSSKGSGPLNSAITPILAIFRSAFTDFRFGYASAMAYMFFAFILLLTLIQVSYFRNEEK